MLSWFHPTKPMYISPIYIAVSSCIFVCNFSKLSHFEVNNYKIIPAIRAIFVISYFSVWVILGCTFLGDEYFLKNKNYRGIERNLCLELSFFFFCLKDTVKKISTCEILIECYHSTNLDLPWAVQDQLREITSV